MWYTLVIKNVTKKEVMEICSYAVEYERVNDEVHCLYNYKFQAMAEANSVINAKPNAKCEVWKMKNEKKATFDWIVFDEKIWEN